MAYKLRYYKGIMQGGDLYRLEIYKKDSDLAAVEIGDVLQDLSLEIQGQQDDIDTPIVKTSLSMTFVDAYDLENGKKNGMWEEFYSPDALAWKVVLTKWLGGSSLVPIWVGFVTPDSYSENLTYRGSVNIIARDNIGFMQDFPFDATGDDGLISLREIVNLAFLKASIGMQVSFDADANWMQTTAGTYAPDTLMNVSAFEGKSWYEALEMALYAYGAVLRFDNYATFRVMTLRSLPHKGYANMDAVPRIAPQFAAGATRELMPACKRIEEVADYELSDKVPFERLSNFFSSSTYPCSVDAVTTSGKVMSTSTSTAPVKLHTNKAEGWFNAQATTLFFDASTYAVDYFIDYQNLAEEVKKGQYIACNNTDSRLVVYRKYVLCSDFGIRMNLGRPIGIYQSGAYSGKLGLATGCRLKRLTYAVTLQQNGVTYYYWGNGNWGTAYKELTQEYDILSDTTELSIDVQVGNFTGVAFLSFGIIKMEYVKVGTDTGAASYSLQGLYANVQDIAYVVAGGKALCKKNAINLNYVAENNIILSRDPQLAPALDSVLLPEFIKNGIFEKAGDAATPTKSWQIMEGLTSQMSVGVHMSLLAYYAKPNNLITGTIVNSKLSFSALYRWNGADHMLVSGRYNFLNGYIEGAVLREFATFDSIWSGSASSGASLPDTEQKSSSSIEAGGTSGAATYSQTTNVNLGGDRYWVLSDDKKSISTDKEVIVNNNLVVSGDVASGSDIRFKEILEHKVLPIETIADAPLFKFLWKDREDNLPHLGSSAQYWEDVAPELVCGEDFKRLNYASLGVAMGISLAKKMQEQEEIIKELKAEIERLKNGIC